MPRISDSRGAHKGEAKPALVTANGADMASFGRVLGAVSVVGITCAMALFVGPTGAAGLRAHPGAPAPAFSAKDISGQVVNLDNYRGKTVILEWTNNGCPFVGKHYIAATCNHCSGVSPERATSG